MRSSFGLPCFYQTLIKTSCLILENMFILSSITTYYHCTLQHCESSAVLYEHSITWYSSAHKVAMAVEMFAWNRMNPNDNQDVCARVLFMMAAKWPSLSLSLISLGCLHLTAARAAN